MSELGSIAILLSFFITLYSLAVSAVAARTGNHALALSGGNGLLSVAFLLIVAVCCLVYELVTLDFSLRYVALNTSTDLPIIYRITALWAGQAGSLLLWSFILSLYVAFVVLRTRRNSTAPYVNAVLCAVSLFFLFLIAYVEDPFGKLGTVVGEGRGLNPILQNVYMAIHPVTLYVGYVGITIPFAFGIAALLSGHLGDEWIRNSRKYALFSWMFLSAGLLLGARWAYLELGWGGYWAWDPVENAAFMPWLSATAFLHSVMIQERKAMLKKWNMILLITTFFLSIFGTFITRSGIVSSVHSFARSDIGPIFLGFMIVILLFSFSLLAYRSKDLRSEERFDSILSRESAFLFNNLLFLAAAFSVFLGTIFPILSEAFTGKKILVGPPYFNTVGVPIGLVLILLMGIGPLISWKKASVANLRRNFVFPAVVFLAVLLALLVFGMKEPVALISFALCGFVASTVFLEYFRGLRVRTARGENTLLALFNLVLRNRRRYGGYIVHLGVVLLVIGITASSLFVTQKEVVLGKGDSFSLGRYDLVFRGVHYISNDAKDGFSAEFSIENSGKNVATIYPEKNIYKYEGNREINQETEVALRSTFRDDLYLILSEVDVSGRVNVRALLNPMVNWIWAGGVVIVLGATIAMWPERRRKKEFSA